VHLALFSPQTVSAFSASKSKALGFNKGWKNTSISF
jgi:hypothetical protein